MDVIEQLSAGLADRIAAAAAFTVGIHTGKRPASGILWRPDVVVASEQMLPEDASTCASSTPARPSTRRWPAATPAPTSPS